MYEQWQVYQKHVASSLHHSIGGPRRPYRTRAHASPSQPHWFHSSIHDILGELLNAENLSSHPRNPSLAQSSEGIVGVDSSVLPTASFRSSRTSWRAGRSRSKRAPLPASSAGDRLARRDNEHVSLIQAALAGSLILRLLCHNLCDSGHGRVHPAAREWTSTVHNGTNLVIHKQHP